MRAQCRYPGGKPILAGRRVALRCRRCDQQPAAEWHNYRYLLLIRLRFLKFWLPGEFSLSYDRVGGRVAHHAMNGLGAEVAGCGPAEDQRNVRIRNRVLHWVSSGDADLQRGSRRRVWLLEGGAASIPGYKADRAFDLEAGQSGRAEGGAAVHVGGDRLVRELDVMRVRTLAAFGPVGKAIRGSVVGHRHIRQEICGEARCGSPIQVDIHRPLAMHFPWAAFDGRGGVVVDQAAELYILAVLGQSASAGKQQEHREHTYRRSQGTAFHEESPV
jgi:hypothetical protein